MHNNLKYISLSLLLLTLLILTTDLVLPGHIFWPDKNLHQYYITAAENPLTYTTPPFCWRIIVPLLVYILPFSSTVSFLIITLASIFLSGIVTAKILERYSFNKKWIYIAIVLFYSTVFAVRYNLIEFYNPDSLLILLVLLGVYFILTKKIKLFLIVSVIGVLVKETYLIVLPLYYTLNIFNISRDGKQSGLPQSQKQYFNRALFIDTLKVSVLPLTAFIAIRLLIQPEGVYNYLTLLEGTIRLRWEYLLGAQLSLNHELFPNQPEILNSIINWYRLTLGAFSGLFILGLIKIKKNRNIFLEYSPLIIGAYAQIFFAVDNERLVVLAFLPLLIAGLFYLKEMAEVKVIKVNLIYAFTALYFGVQLILTHNVYYELYYSVVTQILLTFGFLSVVLVIQPQKKIGATGYK